MSISKITDGANDRPVDDTIAQTGEGLPDDSSKPVGIDEDEAARFEQIIRGMGGEMQTGSEAPDDVEHSDNAVNDKDLGLSPEERTEKEVQQEIDGPLKGSA